MGTVRNMLLGGLAAFAYKPRYGLGPEAFYTLARPGFFGGFGSIIDIFSPVTWNYVTFRNLDEANAVSIYTDWYAVGRDLAETMAEHPPGSLRAA